MKTHTTLTIDIDVLQQAKLIVNNMSGEFEQFLKLRIANIKGDSSTSSLILLEKELSKEINTLDKINASVRSKREQIELLKKKIEEQEVKRINKEKETAQKVLRCVLCGGTIEEQKRELAYVDDDGNEFYHHTQCWLDKYEQHKWKDSEAYVKWLKEEKQ